MIQGNRKILDLLISFTVFCAERPAHNIIYQYINLPIYNCFPPEEVETPGKG